MSDPEEQFSQDSSSGSLGWLWMLLVAGLAFGGGIYFAKPKKSEGITASEKAPPRPLPKIDPQTASQPMLTTTNSGGLLSAPVAPAPVIVTAPITGSTSYNGIIIPDAWPPTNAFRPGRIMDLPYLRQPPEVIDVSVGRQLFVDDFLIESMTNLSRSYYQAEMHTNNPVLQPDQAWEQGPKEWMAMPDQDGMWWDPTNYHFKMWYRAGQSNVTALTISTNGTNWSKPALHRRSGSNVIQPDSRRSTKVILDHAAQKKSERFKMFRGEDQNGIAGLALYLSADGTNWGPKVTWFGPAPEGSTVFHNPLRERWVFSLVDDRPPRKLRYWEMEDLMTGPRWKKLQDARPWVASDGFDEADPTLKLAPELVQLDATAYESLLVGLFTVGKGSYPVAGGRPARNELYLGFTRDGFHWFRPDRRPFISVAADPDSWRHGDIRSVGGGFHILGRRLNFPFTGKTRDAKSGRLLGSMGFGSIRRDGFASINATGTEGILLTKPIKFSYAGFVLLNMKTNAPDGEIRVAIVSTNGNQLEVTNNETKEKSAFTKENCVAVKADSTLSSVNWSGIPNVGMLIGRPIRLIFYLRNASLYSFWISRSPRGRSEGFSAGGGLHYAEATDSIGNKSYRPASYVPKWKRPPTTTNGVPLQPTPLLVNPAPAPTPVAPAKK
jgi:hypothetical protein